MVSRLNVTAEMQGIVSPKQRMDRFAIQYNCRNAGNRKLKFIYIDGVATQCSFWNARDRKLKKIYGSVRYSMQLPKCKESQAKNNI